MSDAQPNELAHEPVTQTPAGDVLPIVTDWLRDIGIEMTPEIAGAVGVLAEQFDKLGSEHALRVLLKAPKLLAKLIRVMAS